MEETIFYPNYSLHDAACRLLFVPSETMAQVPSFYSVGKQSTGVIVERISEAELYRYTRHRWVYVPIQKRRDWCNELAPLDTMKLTTCLRDTSSSSYRN